MLSATVVKDGLAAADAAQKIGAKSDREREYISVYGAGRAAELAGNRTSAQKYYSQLVKICERGDRQTRTDLEHARQYIGASPSFDRR